MIRTMFWAIISLTIMSPALGQSPVSAPAAIDPSNWRGEIAGQPTQILNLGSAHLGQMSPAPGIALLEPLLERLVAFRPDIITQEGVPGEQCETMRATPALYYGAAEGYCWDVSAVQTTTDLGGPEARIAVAAALADWPGVPSAAQRRRLVTLFLSANDRPSALVQWLQLSPIEQVEGDGLTPELVTIMQGLTTRVDETYAIAAVVAARLGHARIHAVDDHSSDSVLAVMPVACEAVIERMWASPAVADLRASEAPRLANLTTPDAMLRHYLYMNDPATQRRYIDVDHRAAVGSGGAGDCGRRYVAWWETRNLRMVANIRAAMGARPGARVLNIVGASHKPYYDLYLGQMADAVIVDAATALGSAP